MLWDGQFENVCLNIFVGHMLLERQSLSFLTYSDCPYFFAYHDIQNMQVGAPQLE
jgi:hypothetical protein